MGMRTNAILTALNYYFNNKLEQEKQRRDDQRKLDNIKKEYIQQQTLRRDFEPTAVAAEEAKNMQALNQANLFNDRIDKIAKIYDDDLNFKSKYQPEENEYKLDALRNKKSLQPHQFDYDLVKLRTGIDKMLTQPELDAKKQEYEDKLNSIKLSLYNQRLANEKARGDKIKALGSISAAGSGKGRAGGLNPAKFIELMKERRAIVEEINRTNLAYENIQKDYTKDPHYQMLIRSLDIIDEQLGEISPEASAAALAKTKESLSGIGSSTDKLVNDQFSSKGEKPKPKSDKTSAIEKALPKEKPYYDERGLYGKVSDWVEEQESGIRKHRQKTQERLNKRTDDYYKTDKPYGPTGKLGRDIYNLIRQTRDDFRRRDLPPTTGTPLDLGLIPTWAITKLLGL